MVLGDWKVMWKVAAWKLIHAIYDADVWSYDNYADGAAAAADDTDGHMDDVVDVGGLHEFGAGDNYDC
jgi:hypothetical protein